MKEHAKRSFTPGDFEHMASRSPTRIAISGMAGVGTSSLFEGLKEHFPRYRHSISAGDFTRSLQKKYGFPTIGEFVSFMNAHPNLHLDDYIDDQVRQTAEHEGSIVEGRVSYLFAPLSFKVRAVCPVLICAERRRAQWAKRDGKYTPFDVVLRSIQKRNFEDTERYRKKYPGYDWGNADFDFVIDTSVYTKAQVLELTLQAFMKWAKRIRKVQRALKFEPMLVVPVEFPKHPRLVEQIAA